MSRARPVRRYRLIAVAAFAVVAAVVAGLLTSGGHHAAAPAFKRIDPDAAYSAKGQAGIPNEGPDATYAAQQEALRAYPAAPGSIPLSAQLDSQATFASVQSKGDGPGDWQLIGPDQAKYPAVLDQFLAGGKDYIASGRVTALAIGGCKNSGHCSLYLGAAGGGVWTAENATGPEGNVHWRFVSGSFDTNAIGSLLVDPADPTGNTVYAGTGEPNASGDSEAGMGIYKSTDGGQSWSLVPGSEAFRGRAVSSLALDSNHNLLVGIARGVRGISSVTGGATSNPPVAATLGLYRQSGSSFGLIWDVSAISARGVNEVGVDPNNSSILYSTAFQAGVYRSADNGATWTQIRPADQPLVNTDRSTFALAKLKTGKTRMYVGDGNQGVSPAHIYRTDDAAGAATFTDMTTAQSIDYCTGQCWYDNVVYSPPENPDVVYLGGSFDYNTVNGPTNGRAVLMSTDGGQTWTDETRDVDNNGWIHPDQHAIVTVPGKPLQFIEGDDGGVVRSSGEYTDASNQCAPRGLTGAALDFCTSLLKRVPTRTSVLNKGLSTLQFQSFSVDPKNAGQLMGGTQDNGTFQFSGSTSIWPQIIYGDGGQSGWNAANSDLRFNTFTGQANDANFRGGDPSAWVIIGGPIASSPEGSLFYPPIIADPNKATAGSIFQGSQSVWRTQDWGGDQADLEANCPEFTTAFNNPNCGDFVQIGPAGNTDLTAASYGDRNGGNVAAIERAPQNTGTMWVATTTGRVFVTTNANDPDPTKVTWTRLDSSAANDPQRFVSSIYVDPKNAEHAWISYSGYNFNTPTTPGHVFEVTRSGSSATWTDITYNLADLPVTDLVRDDVTGDLYAATDFGVMRLASGSTTWTVAANGMPQVEVAGLTIVPGARVLYAATHGRGGWKLQLH